MATTRAKESCGLGKERKITAPSSVTIPNTPTKRTPKSSPRGPSTDQKLPFASSSSSSSPSSSTTALPTLSEKHVPNYLKSTASSRHDHSSFKPIKKSAGPAPLPEGKPCLNRRRSFDKPPPCTPRLDKPFRSPGPRNRATHVPVRSSSFGAKSTTTFISSAKPGFLERSASKISKVGGKPQQPVHSLKTSSNVKKSLKRETSNAASEEMVPKTKNAVEHVDQSPSFVLGMNDEELAKIECELDPYLPDPMPELDKELRTDQEEKKAVWNKEEVGRKDAAETFKVVVTNEEVDETPLAADAKTSIWKEENRYRNEEEKPERIAVEKVEVVDVAASEESTDNQNEKKETEAIEKTAVAAAEKEAEKAAGKPRQGGPARKESPAMYNHVIEETASKLLEKRNNKVRALAGAFQTVIDYESSSK